MFVANTGLRAEKAEVSLRNIMTASVQYMFEDAAQVRCLPGLLRNVSRRCWC